MLRASPRPSCDYPVGAKLHIPCVSITTHTFFGNDENNASHSPGPLIFIMRTAMKSKRRRKRRREELEDEEKKDEESKGEQNRPETRAEESRAEDRTSEDSSESRGEQDMI